MSDILIENIRRAQDQPGWLSEDAAREARQRDIDDGIRALKAAHTAGNQSEGGLFRKSWSEVELNLMRSGLVKGLKV